ncbi:ankyrin [Pyronema domesticum]|nr:ankyrin [Pyronema domesticum]
MDGVDLNAADNDGRTPLMWSVVSESGSKVLKLILARQGVNVNWRARDGLTALSLAVGYGFDEAAAILREHGATM